MSTADENLKRELAPRFRDLLAALKITRKITQGAMAVAIPTAPGFISDIMNGKKLPSLLVLRGLRREFGVSLHWLLAGEGAMFGEDSQVMVRDPLLGRLEEALRCASPKERDHLEGTVELILAARRASPKLPWSVVSEKADLLHDPSHRGP